MTLKGELLFWVFKLVSHGGPNSVLFVFGSLHQAGPDGSVAAWSSTLNGDGAVGRTAAHVTTLSTLRKLRRGVSSSRKNV